MSFYNKLLTKAQILWAKIKYVVRASIIRWRLMKNCAHLENIVSLIPSCFSWWLKNSKFTSAVPLLLMTIHPISELERLQDVAAFVGPGQSLLNLTMAALAEANMLGH